MITAVPLQDIEDLRQQAGIDDVELRREIHDLKIGQLVRLTFVSEVADQTMSVRITSIRGRQFRGKLAAESDGTNRLAMSANSVLRFTANHIHSVVSARATR